MDDRRFDSFVKSLAAARTRRTLLRGLVGTGSALLAGGALHGRLIEAARRPTPTPKPVTCPGQQTPCGTSCCCPDGAMRCGPDCCPAGAECCDNACCYGTCVGEELCCPSPQEWCEATGECCAGGEQCCDTLGCLALGPDQCCFDAACPSGSVCDLERLSCVCAPGFIACGGACIQGDCCSAVDCPGGEVCHEGSCCSPRTCATTPPDSFFGCGVFDDECGGVVECSCPDGWECRPLTTGSYCRNLTTSCIPGVNLCTLDFTTTLYIGTCNGTFQNFCYDDLEGGAMCTVGVTCQECTVDDDCIYEGWRCIQTCDWQGCPGNTACASPA